MWNFNIIAIDSLSIELFFKLKSVIFGNLVYIEYIVCSLVFSENYLFYCTCNKCNLEADQPDTTSEDDDDDDDCMEFVE